MKALIQEMVGNFSAWLKPFGIKVGKLTVDSQMTKQQISETRLIVTTPEIADLSYTKLVWLTIIDEIHLLHDQRGPVLEAIIPNLPNLERTLYAALCPSPQTFPILRSACKTWEDHLWDTLSVICEQRESAELDRLASYFSSFWEEQEQDGDDSGEPNYPLHPPPLPQLHTNNKNCSHPTTSDWEPKFSQRSPRYKLLLKSNVSVVHI
ncbi:hypothetical protein F5887DRAFT_1080882 [Amanita rubescens]|nr:hypothetical protein F5887DRAFT_1080882 [Amanita rubescens]